MVLANAGVVANLNIIVPIPFIYNIPLKPLSNFENIVFNVSECNEWYLYTFEPDTPQEDKEFFGRNPGSPLLRPQDKGMLKSGTNVLTIPCKDVNKTVPYFLEHEKDIGGGRKGETPNEYVFRKMMALNDLPINMTDKLTAVTGLEEVPDGILRVARANKKGLDVTLQVNDMSYF